MIFQKHMTQKLQSFDVWGWLSRGKILQYVRHYHITPKSVSVFMIQDKAAQKNMLSATYIMFLVIKQS